MNRNGNHLSVTVIIVLLSLFVNGVPLYSASASKVPAKRDLSVLVREVLGEGIDEVKENTRSYTGKLARDLGYAEDPYTLTESFIGEESADEMGHAISLVIEVSSEGARIPVGFIFQSRKQAGRDGEVFVARTGLDGKVIYAEIGHDKRNDAGEWVRGSAVAAKLDVESSMALDRLRHELEVWLEGKHLRPKFRKEQLESLEIYRKKMKAEMKASGKKSPKESAEKADKK